MRTRPVGVVLLLIVLVLGSTACSNRQETSSDTALDSDTTPPAEETVDDVAASDAITEPDPEALAVQPETSPSMEAPAESITEPPAVDEVPVLPTEAPPAATSSPESLQAIFEGAGQSLAALESYRYVTTFVYAGVDDGEAEEGSIELRGAVSPGGQHLHWIDLSTGEGSELIRIGEDAWILDEGTWQEVPALVAEAMSQAVLVLAPAFSWEGLYSGLPSSSARVGEEMIQGIQATHYTSTYQEWGRQFGAELVHTQGDVWIADEGYPVKYEFTASGLDEDGEPGTLVWTMELRDVNADIVIEAPVEASGGG